MVSIDFTIWQNVVLGLILVYMIIRLLYNLGYEDGVRQGRYAQRQKEIEESGVDYFVSANGCKIPYPPMPKVNVNGELV